MKKKLLIATLFAASATGSFAQSKFEGAYGQVGIGYFSANPSIKSSTTTTSLSSQSFPMTSSINSTNSFNGALSAGYTFSLTKDYTLGLGVDYQPFASSSGNYSLSNSNLGTSSGTWKVNNGYNIYLAPGFVISPEQLVYAKLGYAGTQIKTTPSGGSSGTTNYNGYLLGLGYKQIISGGLYGFGEVNYTSYGNQTSNTTGPITGGGTYNIATQSNANAVNILVGVGYKF